MKTTKNGIGASTLRWIPRHLVKALAAVAVLVAAALPLAIAGEAGATTPPTVSTLHFAQTLGGSNLTLPGIGEGASIYVNITGSGFAFDGANNLQVTTTAPGVTFLEASETSATTLQAAIVTTGATTPGSYPVSVTDSNGTGTSATNILTIDPDPTITTLSSSSVPAGNSVAMTITGTGFDCFSYPTTCAGGPTNPGVPVVTVTNVMTGVPLYVATGSVAVTGVTSSLLVESGTGLTFTLYGENANSPHAAAPAGTYTVTITNPDQGAATSVGSFTVTASGITEVSPSALPASTAATPITISGSGFEPGATISSTTCGTATVTFGTLTILSPTSATDTVATSSGAGTCQFTIDNPSTPTGNGAVITSVAAFGVGQASVIAPTITASTLTPNAPVVPGTAGSTPETLTFTGTGFSNYSTLEALTAAGNVDSAVDSGTTCTSNSTGTTLTCNLVVATGAVAGTDGVQIGNGGAYSATSASAFTVAGPVITSASPSSIATGAAVGTVITITGTGFNSTATATFGSFTGKFSVVSPTTATFALTAVAPAAGSDNLDVSQTVSAGVTVAAVPFAYTVDAAPAITTGLTNTSTGAIYVGAGATAIPVTITGTGFAKGATVGSFKNAYGVADAGVTATVTGVNTLGTVISATITIAANDANLSDGYTVTNTDGGTVTVAGFSTGALFIAAGPTITSTTPAMATASGTTAFTITGTGFATGAVVTTSPSNGTCGVTTFVSATTLTVNCSFGTAGTTATSLLVTNTNGGEATSAPVLAAATVVSVTPYTNGESGNGTAGKTVSIQVSGAGFYGQPKVTSTNGIKAVVSADSGTELTVRVTVPAKVGGEHTLTFTEPNGDVFKANFKA